jgi:hypothetical protein
VEKHSDVWLRGILAELLWLASAQGDSTVAVLRRRFIIRFIGSYANSSDAIQPYDTQAIVQFFGSKSQLRSNLASNLLIMLNAKEPGTNVFRNRPHLRSLIRDILELPPEETTSAADEESSSDIADQIGGEAELRENIGDVMDGNPTEPDVAGAVLIQDSPVWSPSLIPETGENTLSEATQQDAPPTEDPIVARFLAGKFQLLRAKHHPVDLISALSSSVAVMRSLLSLERTKVPNGY